MSRGILAVVLLGGTVALNACSGAAPAPLAGLTPFGGTWTVLAIGDAVIEEKARAPGFQFQVGGSVEVVTRCGWYELRLETLTDDRITFGAPAPVGNASPCDARDRTIEAEVLAVLDGVQTFSDGRPGDRLTLAGPSGRVVLAQPAANPTFCIDC